MYRVTKHHTAGPLAGLDVIEITEAPAQVGTACYEGPPFGGSRYVVTDCVELPPVPPDEDG